MAGKAKTNEFMLSTATVMIGLPAELHDLNPAEHSIGLVKNFTFTSEPAYTELTQGVKGSIVASVMTSNPVRATMEVYEYTAKNLGYALGIDGAQNLEPIVTTTTVSTAVDGDASPAPTTVSVTSATGIVQGDTIMIMIDNEDNFMIRKVTNVATNTLTLSHAITQDIPLGAVVKKVNVIPVGSKDEQPYFAAKIAGVLVSGEKVVIEIPKIRIVRGFNMAFSVDNFGNLPMEFTLYDLVTTDTLYAEFPNEQARIYRA